MIHLFTAQCAGIRRSGYVFACLGRGRMRLALALAAVLALLVTFGLGVMQAVQAQTATILYVDEDAPGPTHDGLSWTTAYTTVQDALDVANTPANAANAYEIWVAEGVYYPDEGLTHNDNFPSESFRIASDNVQLYGGFAGTEMLRTQRDWATHVTVLSGDIDGNDMVDGHGVVTSTAGIAGTNAVHVLYVDGENSANITAATVIDGFTVTGGNATGSGPDARGGGLYCAGSGSGNACSPTLSNLVFSGNQAGLGGGMYNDGIGGVSSPTLTDVTFDGNRANQGGGGMLNVASAINAPGESSPTLTDVAFIGNQAGEYGGGMVNSGASSGVSSPMLTDVTFSGNQANYGGGMYNSGASSGVSSPMLTDVTFSGNQANYGGGMYTSGRDGVSSPTLTDVTFDGNRANQGGGGMLNVASAISAPGESSPTLTDVAFIGNQAGEYGGGMANSGGMSGASSPALTHVTFIGNLAYRDGGGMYNSGSYSGQGSATLTDVVFSGNSANGSGGAVYNSGFMGGHSSPRLTNVTLSGNRAGVEGGGMYNVSYSSGVNSPILGNTIVWGNTAANGSQIFNSDAAPTLSHSLVQGGCPDGSTCGDGMLDVDPRFVQPIAASSAPTTTGDYRLQLGSPAIDAGNTLSVTVATDLDGNPRVVSGVVDMGAYETLMPILQLAKQAAPTSAPYGSAVTYTLVLSNTGAFTGTATLIDTLPPGVSFAGWIENPGASVAGNQVGWSGEIAPSSALTVSFTATQIAPAGALVTNTAVYSGLAQAGQASATFASVQAGTTTALTSAPNPSALGQAVTFTATVGAVAPGAGMPTGVVLFRVNGVDFPVAVDRGGVAVYATNSLGVGEHVVSAAYGGDGNFLPSESQPVTQTVTGHTLGVSTVGQGAVVAQPQQDTYAHGTVVTLTAQADVGWAFTGWSGDVGGMTNPVTLDMTANRAVTATFEALTYTLDIQMAGLGAVVVEPHQDTYAHRMAVTLTAQAQVGWAFAGWSGDIGGMTNPTVLTMDADKTVTATFEAQEFSLTVNVVGNGEVSKDPDQTTYLYGDVVTLTATAGPGWSFAGWGGGVYAQADLVTNPLVLTVSENTMVTATFEALSYAVSVAADPAEGGTVSGAGVYAHGAQAEVSATPAAGWTFVEWQEGAARVSGDALYGFSVTGDRSLTALFRESTGEEPGPQPGHRVLLPVVVGGE